MPIVLSNQALEKLKNSTDHAEVYVLLESFSRYKLSIPAVIKVYHDILLFYCAFPHDKKMYTLAFAELERIAEAAGRFRKSANSKTKLSLQASGIANTDLLCSYSSSIASWLVNKFPAAVELAGSDASIETVSGILQSLLPYIEFERTTQGNLQFTARLKRIAGLSNPGELLKWLLQVFEESKLPGLVKETLYQELKIFVHWKLDDGLFNRSFLRLPIEKQYYQRHFIKKINSSRIVKQALGKAMNLSALQRTTILDCMKASLAFQYRETDPVTYADINELELFDMGRGLQVAVVGMIKERRLSLESYVGYMAFKNGIPVSYGGGWLWGTQCKIGINIYAPFRRGESAWLFCQVQRVYYQYFGARQFIVKPYQYGKGNPEGLKSGAFWFYYKLGFRPVNSIIKEAAAIEWKKIQTIKKYRSPLKVMQHFTNCNIEWAVAKNDLPGIEAGKLSSAASNMINKQFNADRELAIKTSLIKMKQQFPTISLKKNTIQQQQVIEHWALVINLLDEIKSWNAEQKKEFFRMIQLKQHGKERDYIIALQKHTPFWNLLTARGNL